MQLAFKNNYTSLTDEYRQFASKKDQCRQCPIYDAYKQVVQSEGNASNPTFMFIGESPGSEESNQCRPFIGQAGLRLRSELRKYPTVFNKQTCLFSNVICCRPQDNQFPTDKGHWHSQPDHPLHCVNSWLHKEIAILQPKIIVILGAKSLKYVRNQKSITEHRGSWLYLKTFKCWSFATYHPSYVLRCANDNKNVINEFENDILKLSRTWEQVSVCPHSVADQLMLTLAKKTPFDEEDDEE